MLQPEYIMDLCTAYSAYSLSKQLLKFFVKNSILIRISSNLLHNIKTCICIRKKYKNEEFSPSHFWRNLAKNTVL